MDIKKLTTSLYKKHGTRCPFTIAKAMGYNILYVPLIDVRGFYQYINRCHTIYISSTLDEQQARFVCAHELGHSLLHKGMNRLFLDLHTHMVASRYETEADRFAVDLLFDDADLVSLLDCPISATSRCLGVSFKLAEYRMGSVASRFY